ncbi:hypothetical protein [Pyruvatibacter sp.]
MDVNTVIAIATSFTGLVAAISLCLQIRSTLRDRPSALMKFKPTGVAGDTNSTHVFLSVENHTADSIQPMAISARWPGKVGKIRVTNNVNVQMDISLGPQGWQKQITVGSLPLLPDASRPGFMEFLWQRPTVWPLSRRRPRFIFYRRGRLRSVPINFP